MTKSILKHLVRLALGLAALALAAGCSKKMSIGIPIGNQLPTVRLSSAPIDTAGVYYYAYTVNWVGFDPDGRVDHYLYTIDPQNLAPGQDTVWVTTANNEQKLFFQSRDHIELPGHRLIGREFHVFLIKAIDDKGAAGPFTARAFYSFTVAPDVRVNDPAPGAYPAFVTPSVRVNWSGEDPDGVFTTKPVKYKYLLLSSSSEFPKDLAFANPDSLRRYYEHHPKGAWAGWDSTSAETTQVQFTNLTPGNEYVFVVIAFDEAGAYSPIFSFQTNMITLRVGFAGVYGPVITMFNEFFNYTYLAGGFCNCELAQVPLEVPGLQLIDIHWFAEPPPGADIRSYRWALDIEDPKDDTPRSNELTDVHHYSAPSANVTSADVGPFRGGEVHFFYIVAEDNNGLKSLGIIRLSAVVPTFENPLLVIDDTRLRVDIRQAGESCVELPSGLWPTRAEMDTFLFARGGTPWQCYPDVNMKPLPGLFAGYKADSFGTRIGLADLTVRLSRLGRYRGVIWMTDGVGLTNTQPGSDPTDPMGAMRFMGLPGSVNTLAAYVSQGGKVWFTGGAAALAVSEGFNDRSNDTPTKTYDSAIPRELGPGRFMYDVAKWQSAFRGLRVQPRIIKTLGRFTETTTYAGMPDKLEGKTPGTDPLELEAPTRLTGEFYRAVTDIEYLFRGNQIVEDVNADPDSVDERSTLDTLYRVNASQLPELFPVHDPNRSPSYVIMTYYHGPAPKNRSFIMSGFPLWFFKRQQAQQLVDRVLQDLWGIPKSSPLVARTYAAAGRAAASASAPARLPAGARSAAPLGVMKKWSPRNPRD